MEVERKNIPLSLLRLNEGQVRGLPRNPRTKKNGKFQRLKKSLSENPEMLELRELIVYPSGGVYVVIGGNMRLSAMRELDFPDAPCKVLPEDTPLDNLKAYVLKDNGSYGEWDFDELSAEWDLPLIEDSGIDLPEEEEKPKKPKEKEEDEDEEKERAESFYRSMYKDCLYESDNPFDIPNLLLDMQAGHVELPLSPWGANSRLRKDVATYHFYVDDYRFEYIFKNPINLLTSGCKAVVEPNCSLHDQTPIAWGLQLIYKKRWISRYFQECGIRVYADLNVSHKFIEYNKMGIPKGYNAFFTRGLDGWMESLKSDLEVAREISGLERPNLVVYGGGMKVKEFCQEHSLLYITDFINAKKIGVHG